MKTSAVLFTGKNQVEFGEVQCPAPGPKDVVVRTRYSWISNGTEGSFLRCERVDGVVPWQEGLPLPFPMVPGYQKVGIVESVGADVQSVRPGQWVFATITPLEGVHLGFGGHVEVGAVPEQEVIALPDGADPIAHSGLVLTQVGYNTGSRGFIDNQSPVVVVGDGLVGQWSAQTLQMRGARVALLGRHADRLNRFSATGNDLLLNEREEGWLERMLDWAGGELQAVIDTVGYDTNKSLNDRLLQHIRSGGDFVTAGHAGDNAQVDIRPFIQREVTIHLPCGWNRPRLEKTMQLVHEGKLHTTHLITHRFPAHEAAAAWDRIRTDRTTLGVVLEWPEQ